MTPEQLSVIEETASVFRDYRLPAYELDTMDQLDFTQVIFQRLNTGGVALSEEDINNAFYSRPSFDARSWEGLARSLEATGFGAIPVPELRGYLGPSGVGVRDLPGLEHLVRASIKFLRAEAGVPHLTVLPQPSAIPAVAAFLHRHGTPIEGRLSQLLSRWLWRRFVDDAEAPLLEDMQRALAADPYDTLAVLLNNTPSAPVRVSPQILRHGDAHARSLGLLGLLYAEPLDLATGDPLDTTSLLRHGRDPLFPVFQDSPHRLDLPNLLIVDTEPQDSLVAILDRADQDVLHSHLIDTTALTAIRRHDEAAFLDHRGERLLEATQLLVDTRAEWGARGGRTMATLMRTVA